LRKDWYNAKQGQLGIKRRREFEKTESDERMLLVGSKLGTVTRETTQTFAYLFEATIRCKKWNKRIRRKTGIKNQGKYKSSVTTRTMLSGKEIQKKSASALHWIQREAGN